MKYNTIVETLLLHVMEHVYFAKRTHALKFH